MNVITSLQNPKIKELIKLQQKSRERKQQGLFVTEGIQENLLALENQYTPEKFFICPALFKNEFALNKIKKFHHIEVSQEVYEKLAYRQSTEGVIGIYQQRLSSLKDINLKSKPLIIVLEEIEKPGNLGAILRSADATNADAVVICDERVDFFNPNVIRNSVGTVFTNKLIIAEKEALAMFCKENNIQLLPTFLREETQNFFDCDLTRPTALVFGTESTGLSDFWATHSNTPIKIPMLGQVDSLNVSNAVAVCLYEAIRQRNF